MGDHTAENLLHEQTSSEYIIIMQLKKWLAITLVAALLQVATPIILVSSTAAATTATIATLGITVSNPALAAVGAGAVLLGAAGLAGAAIGSLAGRRRGKRALTGVADDGFSVDAIDILFSTAGALDRETNCGLRLVCELAATPENQLAADEALLMSLFGDARPLSHDQINGPSTPFQLAVFLGRQSQSAATCATTYSKCQYNSNQIMEILRQNGNGIGQA